jgi:surface antigen
MFSRIINLSLVALGALTIALSPISADAGERRHGGGSHWKHSSQAHGGKHNFDRRRHRRGHERRRHGKRRWRHHRHYRNDVTLSSFPTNFDLSGDKTIFGGLIGAVLGATLGSKIGKGSGNTAAIVGGGVLGALVGGNIGRGMDQTDQAATARVLETSPTGNTVTWRNVSTGSSYEITPVRTYQASGNRVCRDFSSWAVIDGYEEQLRGTACRMPDGSWKRVS